MSNRQLPMALQSLTEIRATIGARGTAFFLDLDGTLAPLVPHPDLTVVAANTRAVLAALAEDHLVCVVSGRGLADLRPKVGLYGVYYAADHGHRILGPPGSGVDLEVGPEDRRELEAAAYTIEGRLRDVEGVVVETKDVSLSVHYRLVAERDRPFVEQVAAEAAQSAPGLKLTAGKLVHELRPNLSWGKGHAVLWLLRRLRLEKHDICPVCLGDDVTDEDMFSAVADRGVSLVVGGPGRPTRAGYVLRDTDEATAFLQTFVTRTLRT